MYTDMTYEKILRRMLDKVPNTIDKRQGSIIYDALAPAAAELTQMYIELNRILALAFASTSSGEYLDKRAEEMGVYRRLATKAKRLGLFYDKNSSAFDVPIGSRFSIDDVYYTSIEKLSVGRYLLECEVAGEIGNIPEGHMIALDYIPGLAVAELTDILEAGTETETDADLLQRYQLRARLPATSGNVYHYRQWALEVPGVGDAKIFPLWDGAGTVKVVIVDTLRRPAELELVNFVKDHLETVRPIGADVTVISALAREITISARVTLAQGYSIQGVQETFAKLVDDYCAEVAFNFSYISYARLGSLLLDVPGVVDHSGLLLNSSISNIALGDEEVPIVGEIALSL